ncbi:MAG: hypothetical protein ACFFAO_17750 [Candidatus Hermodarchaeota archaeon]
MPYIVVTARFPLNKGTEAAEIYIEERKAFPPDRSLIKELVPNAIKVDNDKIRSLYIAEVKDGKLNEALTRQQNAMIMYHDIEGYEYTIDVCFTVVEAMGMIGMKPPE